MELFQGPVLLEVQIVLPIPQQLLLMLTQTTTQVQQQDTQLPQQLRHLQQLQLQLL